MQPWLVGLVWTDYRLAVLLTVIFPLILLVWAFICKSDSIQLLLTIYWRVASLLVITVYLMIAAIPIAFISGFLARILIPIGLWFWVDLNEELDELPDRNLLKFVFTAWRWAITVYCGLGLVNQVSSLPCSILPQTELLKNSVCSLWLEAPYQFREFFHANTRPNFLGFLGIVGLAIYMGYLGHFVLVRLGKQGRSASGH